MLRRRVHDRAAAEIRFRIPPRNLRGQLLPCVRHILRQPARHRFAASEKNGVDQPKCLFSDSPEAPASTPSPATPTLPANRSSASGVVRQRCSRGQTSRRAPLALRTTRGAGSAVVRHTNARPCSRPRQGAAHPRFRHSLTFRRQGSARRDRAHAPQGPALRPKFHEIAGRARRPVPLARPVEDRCCAHCSLNPPEKTVSATTISTRPSLPTICRNFGRKAPGGGLRSWQWPPGRVTVSPPGNDPRAR